jgi:UDP-N-acetylmuramoyl-L-alanyl-D-glutamate--2,6-diaminopimelate ligase
VTPWGRGTLSAPLLGHFNLHNALAALSALCVHGVAFDDALAVFPRLSPVAGRMERIAAAEGPLVIVDYAHTPDALEQTLRALRRHCPGRLWCVFGCGGDRDRAKRPLMGRIAWEHADELLITSDNPRSEDPAAIIAEIATGLPEHGAAREPDRAAAIRRAIGAARPGDCVLIAGKGHEDYQEASGARTPFSDAGIARDALAAWSATS